MDKILNEKDFSPSVQNLPPPLICDKIKLQKVQQTSKQINIWNYFSMWGSTCKLVSNTTSEITCFNSKWRSRVGMVEDWRSGEFTHSKNTAWKFASGQHVKRSFCSNLITKRHVLYIILFVSFWPLAKNSN